MLRTKVSTTPALGKVFLPPDTPENLFFIHFMETNMRNYNTKSSLLITLFWMLLLTTNLSGQLLLHEGFEYDEGKLHGSNGGVGWSAGWVVQNSANDNYFVESTSPLSFSPLVQKGNYLQAKFQYDNCGRNINVNATGPFSEYISGGRIGAHGKILYVSYLFRPGTDNDQIISLSVGGTAWAPAVADTRVRLINNTAGVLNIRLADGSGVLVEAPTGITLNTSSDNLVVVKLEFNPTTTISLFVNPTSIGGMEPSTPDFSITSSVDLSFTRLQSTARRNTRIDEIRMGKTFADVTPIPTPTLDKLVAPASIWDISGEQNYNLSGIAAGVETDEVISVSATSSNTSVVSDPTVTYTSPATTGSIQYTPVTNGEAWIKLVVTATNVPGVKVDSFKVVVMNSKINHAPLVNSISNQMTMASLGQQTVEITGIDDGDEFYTQAITITAVSLDPTIVPDPAIQYTQGASTAVLTYTPTGVAGTATIELTLQDDANGTTDGGENTTTITFTIQVVATLDVFGWSDLFEDGEQSWWANEYQLTEESGILKAKGNKKTRWVAFGTALGRSIDITEYPFVNIKVRTGDITNPFVLTAYIKDGNGVNANISKRVPPSENYTTLAFDFTGKTIALNNITDVFFAINGENLTWNGEAWIEEVHVGYYAQKYCNIGAVKNKEYHVSAGAKSILLTDLENVATLTHTGGNSLIQNVSFTVISNNMATMSFDLIEDATGEEQITIHATAATGYVNNFTDFNLKVSSNYEPTINPVADMNLSTGVATSIQLTGISDGDAAIEQSLTIEATSGNEDVTGPVMVDYVQGGTIAKLSFTPLSAGEDVIITITVNDGQPTNNLKTIEFKVNVYNNLNNPPKMNSIPNQDGILSYGKQLIVLNGISDGDQGNQEISFQTYSSNEEVVPNSALAISYSQGQPKAFLNYTPLAIGTTTITVVFTDNGGTIDNNGNAIDSLLFTLEILDEPVVGYVYDMVNMNADRTNGIWEPNTTYNSIQYVSFDGYNNVMKIDFSNKSNWDGIWSNLPIELNLSTHPYISCEIYPVNQAMDFHVYLFDFLGARNRDGAHAERVNAPKDQWTHCEFDFSNEGYLLDQNGFPIRIDRVTDILLNMHTNNFPFPFTKISGSMYIRNLRIGDQVIFGSDDLTATIAQAADQEHFYLEDAVPVQIPLSGISNGMGSPTGVTLATSTTNTAVTNLSVSEPDANGMATLSYTPGAIGQATITVTASAEGAADASMSFTVNVLSNNSGTATLLDINLGTSYQVFRGIGTMVPPSKYAEPYVRDLGATASRIGIISNRFEPENDNDDPYVLDLAKFNRDVVNWNTIRYLMANGVETFFMTVWSPEAWMKDNFSLDMSGAGVSTNCDLTTNKLSYHYYEEFAESMVAFCRVFQEETGKELDAIGLQNEPAFHEPYPSAILDPTRFTQLIKVVGARFEAEGISTGFIMPEQVITQGANSMDAYINALNADPVATAYSDYIATHGYAADGIGDANPTFSTWTSLGAKSKEGSNPKELWMTETNAEALTWAQGLGRAGGLYAALEHGGASLWTSYSADGQIFDRFGNPTHSYNTYKHFTKFIRPGAVRVGSPAPANYLQTTSFVNTLENGGTFVSVIINGGTTAQTVSLNFSGGVTPVYLDVYSTKELTGMVKTQAGIISSDVIILPAKSITTIVGYTQANELTVANGTGSGMYGPGTLVEVKANTPETGFEFYRWTGNTDGLANVYAASTTYQMPLTSASLVPEYTNKPKYILTVNKGTGGGEYFEGELVNIAANDSTAYNYEFVEWSGDVQFLIERLAASTSLTMPARNVSLSPTYKLLTSLGQKNELVTRIYPVPARDYLMLNIPEDSFEMVSITDLNGRTLINELILSGESTKQIDVSSLNKGVYLIILTTNTKTKHVTKILID
jgi:glucuronoarabinoxylan endo-1,4-beta-xylanase